MRQKIEQAFQEWNREGKFSGVFSVRDKSGLLFERACGFRNRAEELLNTGETAFGIASGTKLFTGMAVCKLIGEGKLSLNDRVWDILPYDLKKIDKEVTVRHLLTHTSGIGDYIDEEASDDYNEMMALYNRYPVYHWNSMEYYLQMYNDLPAKFSPGSRFGYSNAGYALLGLVVESASGMGFHQYVTEHILRSCGLEHTGFYRMDRLPGNTALGHVFDEEQGEWYTNIFCMPAVGGADGGLFTCGGDLDKVWRALASGKIVPWEMAGEMMAPQVVRDEENHRYYGLGVYQFRKDGEVVYYAVGVDFGVDFFTAYFPKYDTVASALGNTEYNTWPLLRELLELFA